MPKYIPLKKWEKFWKLIALWECEKRLIWKQWASARYEKCKCTCKKWKELRVARTYLNTGHTVSCWCARWIPKLKHWDTWSKLYKIYMTAKSRCNNPTCYKYKRYWWRWIKFLRDSYEDFKRDMWEWYLEHIKKYWKENTQIDRIDNNWNYCKDNCRRVTCKENSRNRRSNHLVDFRGERISLIEAYEKASPKISFPVFLSRIYNKWLDKNVELALYWTNKEIRDFLSVNSEK